MEMVNQRRKMLDAIESNAKKKKKKKKKKKTIILLQKW